MTKNRFSKISSIIQDAKKGKMFILVDDKNRENEGDLVIPGSKCNSKNINFMAKHGRGLICLALTKKQVERLSLIQCFDLNKPINLNILSRYRNLRLPRFRLETFVLLIGLHPQHLNPLKYRKRYHAAKQVNFSFQMLLLDR